MIVLDLPMPPRLSEIFINKREKEKLATEVVNGKTILTTKRKGGRKKSDRYRVWIQAADSFYTAQKGRCEAVRGHFRADIILSSAKRRSNADCDNRIKAILDYLQRIELIENDCLADRVSIEWGKPEDAPEGCRVFVFSTEDQREAA